jgi:ABC-type branched-subunit amino acid transport system substrate-binding protein
MARSFFETNNGEISRRSLLKAASKLALLSGTAGIGFPLAAGAADDFRIGWIRPTTGRLASSYAPLYAAGLMAVDEINASGGILGRKIVREEVDDEAAPAKAPQVMKKLESSDIKFVVGPTGDAACVASLPSGSAANMVQGCYAYSSRVMDGVTFPYSYIVYHSVRMVADVCIDYYHSKGVRKFGLLVESTTAGEAATIASKESAQRYGLELTTVQSFPLSSPTVAPYVANLKNTGTECILSFLGNATSAALTLNAMADLQWLPPITGHSGLLYESLLDKVPAEALDKVTGVIYRGLSWTPDRPAPARSVAFAEKLSTYPDITAPYNLGSGPYYDFIYLLKHAIEQEKSFDSQKVKAALDRVKDFEGVRCKISFTPENHCGIPIQELTLGYAKSAKDERSYKSFFRQQAV